MKVSEACLNENGYNRERRSDLLPFDDKDIPLLNDAEPLRSESRGFAPEQMVRCEACLRANPPTRTSCLYCAAQLPVTEVSAALQKPALRHLEKWEHGFSVILVPENADSLSSDALAEAARLLRLSEQDLRRIIEAGEPLPLACVATAEEAALVKRKLGELSIRTVVIADSDLGLSESATKRARAFELTEGSLVAHPAGGGEASSIAWPEVVLLVAGRLFIRELEVEERKGRRAENEIIETREMSADEMVLDIYTAQSDKGWRISAGSFDFSCLGPRKGLVTAQNFSSLIESLRLQARDAIYDDSYNRLRRQLIFAWPLEQQTEARGWRRKRPGQVSTEAVTRSDNELQFTRYSRLRRYLQQYYPQGLSA
jgi:hypothetical protein